MPANSLGIVLIVAGLLWPIFAVSALVVFYAVLCTVYIAGASLWPQYDPEDEKGKIEKILAPKRKATEHGKAEELIARAKALHERMWRGVKLQLARGSGTLQ